jgi:hypothetical protein
MPLLFDTIHNRSRQMRKFSLVLAGTVWLTVAAPILGSSLDPPGTSQAQVPPVGGQCQDGHILAQDDRCYPASTWTPEELCEIGYPEYCVAADPPTLVSIAPREEFSRAPSIGGVRFYPGNASQAQLEEMYPPLAPTGNGTSLGSGFSFATNYEPVPLYGCEVKTSHGAVSNENAFPSVILVWCENDTIRMSLYTNRPTDLRDWGIVLESTFRVNSIVPVIWTMGTHPEDTGGYGVVAKACFDNLPVGVNPASLEWWEWQYCVGFFRAPHIEKLGAPPMQIAVSE